MEVRELKFIGIDFWNRPQFKDQSGNYFGNVNALFDYGASFEKVTETITEDNICYFGREPDCDPDGSKIKASAIKLVKEFTIVFKPRDKVIVNTGGDDIKAEIADKHPKGTKDYYWKEADSYRCKFSNGTTQYIDTKSIRKDE